MRIEFDAEINAILVMPQGPLSKEDFSAIGDKVDPIILAKGLLHGLIIYTESFPGWDSINAIVQHLEFVHEHHKKIKKVALVTDSAFAALAEKFARHFVSAEIKEFRYADLALAKAWIKGGD